MLAQPFVVVQPPAIGRRHDQVAGAVAAELLQVADRLLAFGGMVPRPAAVLVLREWRRAAPVEPQQGIVAAADHQHLRPRWHGRPDCLAQMLGLALIAWVRAPTVGLPGTPPLLGVALLVGTQDSPVLAARDELAERRLAEVVDDRVLDAAQLVAGLPGAVGVVVVLQQ